MYHIITCTVHTHIHENNQGSTNVVEKENIESVALQWEIYFQRSEQNGQTWSGLRL